MSTPDMEITHVPFDDLEFWPGNARRGDIQGIKESMVANGIFNPIIVQKSSGNVMVGNHRLHALIQLNEEDPGNWPATAPVVYMDVDDSRAQRINVADNKLSDDADWDERALADQLTAMLEEEDGLVGSGYDTDEVDDLLRRLDAANADGVGTNPYGEWDGMPEFNQEDLTGVRHMIVHFATHDDVDAFSELVGQSFTDKTKSIWFPAADIDHNSHLRVISEEA